MAYLGINPFSQLKNKWLSGLLFEGGAWLCDNDDRAVSSGCNQLRIRDLGNGGRQTLFDTGTNSIGNGLATLFVPGITWEVGPYSLRLAGGFQRYDDKGATTGRKTGNMFLIGHELFLWSAKRISDRFGQYRGIDLGRHTFRAHRRGLYDCGALRSNQWRGIPSRPLLIARMGYVLFVAPRMSMGWSVLWYDASNLRTGADQCG